ncbi:MAG TPA: acyltransferase [Myxococcaceae bacterium]|nr:acyltransferase [Myxococcaceae bacterium]
MSNITERLRGHFELQNGTSRNLAMEGLRGIAVTLVFLVHYHSVLTPWMAGVEGWGSDFGRAMRFAGAAGVDLFFVLSGYLIYGATLSARFSWGGFMRRRLQRIYPTFLVLLTIYLGLSFLIPSESKLPPGAAEASFYVLQNVLLLPGMFAIKPIITVAWSLSYEMFFYLALPLLMVALKLREQDRGRRLGVFALLSAMIIALPLLGFGHVQFLLFIAGMAMHELRERVRVTQEGRGGRLLNPLSTLLALGALPVSWWAFQAVRAAGAAESTAFVARTVWLTVAFAVVVSVVLTGRGPVARLCRWTPLRWLGNMSYSYYLLHGLILKAFSLVALTVIGRGAHPLLFWALLPIAFVLTLAASGVLFAWVEKPFSLGGRMPWAVWRARTEPRGA